MPHMSAYSVTLTVTTDVQLTDEQARDAAARWATDAGFDLGMTSSARDEPWLRVSAVVTAEPAPDPAAVATLAAEKLGHELRGLGATVAGWHGVEVLSIDEVQRRARQRPSIPAMVNAAEMAKLAGLGSVQRIYQLESERKAGKRADFPAPVLDGYWLRSMAEHWARTRKTAPGPAPRTVS